MKKVLALVLVVMLALVLTAPAYALGPVQTKYGMAQGVPSDGDASITVFKGIPYAAAPIGDLRWKAPQEPASWVGTRVFDKYASAAMQYTDGMDAAPYKAEFYYTGVPLLSEDCLYINVSTSAADGSEKMPVFVWFHGGGLRHGFSYEVEFNNEVMAKKGVVVVTVGQRLGVYGYMALPQLSAETDYKGSGNYGFMDQIKALEWVRDNIAAFGGDPGNVTVGGQSGGTTKTGGVLFTSEYSKGLQHKVIWQSGLKWNTTLPALADAEQAGVEYLKKLGLTGSETLEELRAKDSMFFMASNYDIYAGGPSGMNQDNKYIVTPDFRSQFTGGGLKGIDVLCGTNLGEANYTAAATREEFYANYREMLGDLYEKHDFENLIPKYFEVTDATATDVARTLATLGLTTADSRNLSLAMLFGQKLDKEQTGGSVYTYMFSHFAPGRNVANDWAFHSSEMWYTFASLRDIPEHRDWTEYDHKLADIMSSYWTNFMKTGNPNGAGLPVWEPSTAGKPAYIELGDEIKLDTEIDALDELLLDYTARQFNIER